jgi:hypothetical protein
LIFRSFLASRRTSIRGLAVVLALINPYPTATANAEDTLGDALISGTFDLDIRARHEMVDNDRFARRARSNTIRTRLAFETGKWRGYSAKVEAENILAPGDDLFNDGINGRTDFPVVRDASTTELNQLWLAAPLPADGELKLGRQTIDLGARTFTASARFRQNQQTYDAATVTLRPLSHLEFFYGYVWTVDRTAGERAVAGDWNTSSHLTHLTYDGLPPLKLAAYALATDFDEVPLLSARTAGVRGEGKFPVGNTVSLIAHGEFAWQTDHANNPIEFSERLVIAEGGLGIAGVTGMAGYRLQTGSGQYALQTTLGKKHYNRGWADKFSATPLRGLVDAYVTVSIEPGKLDSLDLGEDARHWLAKTRLRAEYHDFAAHADTTDYGTEYDIGLRQRLYGPVDFLIEYADYQAKGFARDTRKLWVTLQFNL